MNTVKRQLEIVTTFSKCIGMKLAEDKCAFLHFEMGIIKIFLPLNINHLTIQPVNDGDSYKYLQLGTKYLRLTLVSMRNIILQEKFNCYFSDVF